MNTQSTIRTGQEIQDAQAALQLLWTVLDAVEAVGWAREGFLLNRAAEALEVRLERARRERGRAS